MQTKELRFELIRFEMCIKHTPPKKMLSEKIGVE
jgi:hypothetical protein